MFFGGYGCTKRTFLHEFGHALGFHHEHQRPDRASSGIQFYKAFTMLMYPGREPDDMTIDEALKAAGIHFQADDS